MLIAPFTLTEFSSPRARSSRRAAHPATVPVWLITWLLIGALALLLVTELRSGGATGWTLPFWLVVAPSIDVVWITRTRWMALLRKAISVLASTRGLLR